MKFNIYIYIYIYNDKIIFQIIIATIRNEKWQKIRNNDNIIQLTLL